MLLRWLKLDEKRLSQQWIFRLSIAIPFAISFLLCIPLWFETTFSFSSAGYEKFLSMFSLPIGVLSLSIPLVAIVAHIHRTIQTEKQIELINQKNTSDKFYAHYKYITDSFSSIKSSNINLNGKEVIIEISNVNSLYRDFFPNSSPENGTVIEQKSVHTIKIFKSLNEIDKELHELEYERSDNSDPNLVLFNILNEIISLSSNLSIDIHKIIPSENTRKLLFMKNDKKFKMITCFLDEAELKNYLKCIYVINITIMDLLDIKFDYYPSLSNYALSNKKYHFKSSFDVMKKTNEPYHSFDIGDGAFTSEEFDDFNSYFTQ